ncbi:MAG TPA: metallophosphoesterase [Thermoanaerobaculia bacterium]|nr:metallophosphoesterase [Thermoanaerobaculia bacterium]
MSKCAIGLSIVRAARRMRLALFFILALLVFAAFNFVAVRALLRVHPRRRRWIIAAAVLGNLMWVFVPMLGQLTAVMRGVRATIGPLWFAWSSFTILYTMLTLLAGLAWLPLRRRIDFSRFARWPSRIFLSLTLASIPVGIYHALVPLRIERVPIELENLPPAAEGMRIVLLADLHVGLFTRPSRLDTIFATARALEPDAVLILGDLIDDDPYFVPKLLAGTRALAADTPLLAVLGNHEMYGDPLRVIEALRGSRIRLVVNDGVPLGPLWMAGISDYAAGQMPGHDALRPDLGRALSGAPGGAFPIVFSHQPRVFYETRERRLPLTLSAHTHGGQCGFRPLGWSLAGVFLEYHMGLYRWGVSQLYVNTGTGYWLVPFRLGMTPEITLVELRRPTPPGGS